MLDADGGGDSMARTQRPARWWGVGALAVLALLAAGRSAVTIVYLGVAYSDEVDPISTPMSYYAFVDGGNQMYTTATIAMAVGALAVLAGMVWAGAGVAGSPTVLFTVWAVCLLLAAIFPTDDSADIETFGGWVHQFAGVGVFALLSLAGLALASRLAGNPQWRPIVRIVRALSVGAFVLAAAYLLSRLADVPVDGILQRMVFAFDIGVIVALAVHLGRVSLLALRDRTDTWRPDPAGPTAPLGP